MLGWDWLDDGCRVRLVLFDLDGTIIDTMPLYGEIVARLVSERTSLSYEEVLKHYIRTSGRSFRDQLRLMGVPLGLIDDIARDFEREKAELLKATRIDGIVLERISLLKSNGLRVALSTNNECSVLGVIDWIGSVFDYVLCHIPGSDFGKGEAHLKFLLDMGFRKCEIVFIGDSDYDLEVYEGLGVRSVRTMGLWRGEDRSVEIILSMIRWS